MLKWTITLTLWLCLFACSDDPVSTEPASTSPADMSVARPDLSAALDMPAADMTAVDLSAPDSDVPDVGPDASDTGVPDMGSDASETPPAVRPIGVADSPSVMGHFQVDRRASVAFAGPLRAEGLQVQVGDFRALTGEDIGTSPWHVFSATRYPSASARTIWGASLKYLYKFVVDGSRFEFADVFQINAATTSIPWNLVSLDDGRVLVPDGDGYRQEEQSPCYGRTASLLVFRDDSGDPGSKITCEKKFELDPQALRQLCGAQGSMVAGSGNSTAVMWSGEVATTVTFERQGQRRTYMVIVDNAIEDALACAQISDTQISNEAPVERISASQSATYYATQMGITKMVYDSATGTVTKRWERAVPIRERTGTTPTLVDTPDGAFVALVDAPCSTISILNGLVACYDDQPARVVLLRREDDAASAQLTQSVELPAFIHTIENSPAAWQDMIVVANYSGYLPNGLRIPNGGQIPEGGAIAWGTSPDAIPDFARGLAMVRYDAASKAFELAWANAEIQVSGVPTISAAANLVYGTGANEDDGQLYLYAVRLADAPEGPGGQVVWQLPLGNAPIREATTNAEGDVVFPFTDYTITTGELFDAGNNLLVNDDGSLFVAGGSALARIR